MSHRIWWVIAFCALGIGLAIEGDAPADKAAASAGATAIPATVAATPARAARHDS
jgi:hypothetical protein